MDKECLMQPSNDSQEILDILRSPQNLDSGLVASLLKNFSSIWNVLEEVPESSELKNESP